MINSIPENKLPKLLQKIIDKLHLSDVKPFSQEEEEVCDQRYCPSLAFASLEWCQTSLKGEDEVALVRVALGILTVFFSVASSLLVSLACSRNS